jgi:hypothetical protein
MSIGDFFKGLSLDAWYKAFMYIGGVALLLSFFLDVKGITNSQLQLIAGGIFLLGIGEWKNHKEESWIKPPNAYTGPTALITQTVWKPDILGLALDLIGLVLLVIGTVSIIFQTRVSNQIPPPLLTVTPATTLIPTALPSPTTALSPTETLTPYSAGSRDVSTKHVLLFSRAQHHVASGATPLRSEVRVNRSVGRLTE